MHSSQMMINTYIINTYMMKEFNEFLDTEEESKM